jgi:hypothetical protein
MAVGYYDYDDENCIIALITFHDFTDRPLLDFTLSTTYLSIIVDSMFARLFPDDAPLKDEILANLQGKLGDINLDTTTLAWVTNLDLDIIQDIVVVLQEFLYVDAKIGYKKYLDRGNIAQWNRSKEAMLYLQILKLLPPDEYLPPDKMIELEAADQMRTRIYNYLNPQMGGSLRKSLGGSLRVNLPENKLTSLDEVHQYLLDFVSHISKYEDDYFIKLIASNLKDLIFKLKKSVNKSTLKLISNIVHIIYTILEKLKNKNDSPADIRTYVNIRFEDINKYRIYYDNKIYRNVITIYIPPKNKHDPDEYKKKSTTAIENIRKSMATAEETKKQIEQTAIAAREAQVQTTQAKQKLKEAQQLLTNIELLEKKAYAAKSIADREVQDTESAVNIAKQELQQAEDAYNVAVATVAAATVAAAVAAAAAAVAAAAAAAATVVPATVVPATVVPATVVPATVVPATIIKAEEKVKAKILEAKAAQAAQAAKEKVKEAEEKVKEAEEKVKEAEEKVKEAEEKVVATKQLEVEAVQAAEEAKDKKVLDAAKAQAARKAKNAKKLPPPPAPPPRTLIRSKSLGTITGGTTIIEASTGIYRKYLKYKKKYLLLKNKIVNIYIL